MAFPFYKQLDAMDCGPSCLRMITKFYGKNYSLQSLRDKCYITREGVSLLGVCEAAEAMGFRTQSGKYSWEQLRDDFPLPCIIHWHENHFVVVYKVKKRLKKGNASVFVADPAHGLVEYTEDEFLRGWISSKVDAKTRG